MNSHSSVFPGGFDRSHHQRDGDIECDDPYSDEQPQEERYDPSAVRSVKDKTCYPPSVTGFD